MQFLHYLKSFTLITFLGGVGYFGFQIHSTYSILSRAIDTSIIDVLEPRSKKIRTNSKYVLIEQPQKAPSIIDRFWSSVSFSYARRLLNLAHSEDRPIRLRAVKDLSNIQNLDHWHYSLLAHMIDARTAVGLARSKNVNLNYFLRPPNRYVYYNHDKIATWMKHFLISLTKCNDHPCINYFISKAFVNVQEVGRMIEHDLSSLELKQCIQSADDILPLCIESILHHSTIANFARDIVQNNGLPLLMELHKRYKDNVDINISLVRIIANISAYPELLQDIYRSGWVGVLAKFLKNDDIRISGPSAKALANLDSDDHHEGTFERKIYLLYPIHRSDYSRDVDVILVHGLLGGVFFTWRQRDRTQMTSGFLGKKNKDETISCASKNSSSNCKTTSEINTKEYIEEVEERKKMEWMEIGKDFEVVFHDCPKDCSGQGPYSCPGEEICEFEEKEYSQCWPKDWLPQDCPNVRILGINYDTNLSLWSPICPKDTLKNMDDRSRDFSEKLKNAGVGERPIIWLTHSMGGLLVKNMLVAARKSTDENMKKLYKNTKGIVFYSTPHRGSHVASLNQTTSLFVWPSIEVQQLREGCPTLLKLHQNFLDVLEETKIKVISFVETECTTITPLRIQFHFVPERSAQINYGEYYEMPLDHLRICKPISRYSFLYRKVALFIQDIWKETRNDSF